MRSVNLLIKPASGLCNLRCRYCFYADEAKNRAQASMGRMDNALAEALIQKAFAAAEPGGLVTFAFQGGEPTLAGLPFFCFFADTAEKYRPAGVRVQYAIQTNGTLLDTSWAEFFRANRFLVGLSLDGLRAVHDRNRVDAAGGGTWKRVLAARSLLEAQGVAYNALCVVTGQCAQKPEQVYKSLKNLGFRYIQFIACLDPIGRERGQEPWSLTPEAYGAFLCGVFDLWYQDWRMGNYHSVRLFDDYVHILLGDGASACAACGKCGAYSVVEADGSVYPCDFYALDAWRLGNLQDSSLEALAEGETARRFLAWGSRKPPRCGGCPWESICGGGCKRDWVDDGSGPRNYFCAAFRQLLKYALPRLQEIAMAEKAARGRETGTEINFQKQRM